MPIILSIPVVIVILAVILGINTKLEHKPYRISNYMLFGYYTLAYLIVILERIIAVPWLTTMFRVFSCESGPEGKTKTIENFAGEVVNAGFEYCWETSHIILAVYAGFAGLCFCLILALSLFMFSLDGFHSPLPWADEHPFVRLLILIQKLIVCVFFVFDPYVFFKEYCK